MPVRLRTALVVLVVGLAAGVMSVAALGGVTERAPAAPPSPRPVVVPGESFALTVLRDWDGRRAAAWAAGDETRLAGLYVGGSAAATADVGLLRRYRARGLVVRDMRMQILRARVLTNRPRRVVLEVTDRLSSAVAYAATAGARRLPSDAATTHELVLRRVGGSWRMARVSVVHG